MLPNPLPPHNNNTYSYKLKCIPELILQCTPAGGLKVVDTSGVCFSPTEVISQ
jgi:hypothetical protein